MTEQNQQSLLLGKIAAYTEIWAKDPHSTIFVSLSEAYRKMGMLDDARDVAERGLVTNPEIAPAHIVLARILCQQGDYQGSESFFQRALELDPVSLAALVGYARLSILLGQESRARELLLEARSLSPADPVINKLLLSLPVEMAAEVEVEAVTNEEAPALEEATQPPLASLTLAELYLKQGLGKEALGMYRQLSAQKPNDLMLRRQIRDLEEHYAVADSGDAEDLSTDVSTLNDSVIESAVQRAAEEVFDRVPSEISESPVEEVSTQRAITTVSASVELSRQDGVLETLNQWLNNIQQRRGDV